MATATGEQLTQNIRQNIEELKRVCQEVQEDVATRAPEGRWAPKEILSHLLGPEGAGHLPMLRSFLDQDTPRIDIVPEDPFYSEQRARLTFAQLLQEVDEEYERIARFVEGLTKDQLERTAQIPLIKETPFGEYPTLATWIGLLAGLEKCHLRFHIDHMREILQGLGVAAK
jgi:hypothetical protein